MSLLVYCETKFVPLKGYPNCRPWSVLYKIKIWNVWSGNMGCSNYLFTLCKVTKLTGRNNWLEQYFLLMLNKNFFLLRDNKKWRTVYGSRKKRNSEKRIMSTNMKISNFKALHSNLELKCSSRNSSWNKFFAIFEVQF